MPFVNYLKKLCSDISPVQRRPFGRLLIYQVHYGLPSVVSVFLQCFALKTDLTVLSIDLSCRALHRVRSRRVPANGCSSGQLPSARSVSPYLWR